MIDRPQHKPVVATPKKLLGAAKPPLILALSQLVVVIFTSFLFVWSSLADNQARQNTACAQDNSDRTSKPTETSKHLPPLVLDCRPGRAIQPSSGVNNEVLRWGPQGDGASTVYGINDRGAVYDYATILGMLSRLDRTTALAQFPWFKSILEHEKEAHNPNRKCIIILSLPDWQKLKRMSAVKAAKPDG